MLPDLEMLSAYLDGQLTGEERARVERLLEEDGEARHLLEELREVSRAVSTLPRESLPDDFASQVEASLMAEPSGENVDWRSLRRRFLSGRSIAWVAVVLLVALGVNHFFSDETINVSQVARDRGASSSSSSVRSKNTRDFDAAPLPAMSAASDASALNEEYFKANETREFAETMAPGDVPASGKSPELNDALESKDQGFGGGMGFGMGMEGTARMAPAAVAQSELQQAQEQSPVASSPPSAPLQASSPSQPAPTQPAPTQPATSQPASPGGSAGTLSVERLRRDVKPLFSRLPEPEIVVVCEVEKPAEAARDFDRLLKASRVALPRQIVLDRRTLTLKTDQEQPARKPAPQENLQEKTTEEELIVEVDWNQAVDLLTALQKDTKQIVSIRADASPHSNLPEPISQFNRSGREQADEAVKKEQTQERGVRLHSRASVSPERVEGDSYRIRFIFKEGPFRTID